MSVLERGHSEKPLAMPVASVLKAPKWPIRCLLLTLVLACLLPAVVGVGLLFAKLIHDGRAQLQKDTILTARALVQTFDSEVAKAQVVAEALATSSTLEQRNLGDFHRRARELIDKEVTGLNVVLSDENAQMIVNTLRPYGQALPRHGNPQQIRRVFESGQASISNVFIGAIAAQPNFSVDVPVLAAGRVAYVLSVAIVPQQIFGILSRQQFPGDWVASVFDSTGTLLTRSQSADHYAGSAANPELLKRLDGPPEGAFESITKEGLPALIIYSRSPVSRWTVAIAISRQSLEAQLMHAMILAGLGIALLLSLGIGLAWWLGGRIARSVSALTAPASALEAGEAARRPQVYFREADEVVEAMAQTAQLLARRTGQLHDANEELRTSEATLKAAQHLVGVGNWKWDVRTNVHHWSDEIYRIYGRDPALPPAVYPEVRQYFTPASWTTLAAAVEKSRTTGDSYACDAQVVRLDGTQRWIVARGEAVRDAAGAVVALHGTVQDITERKAAETQISALNADLEERVHRRTAELEVANRELEAFTYSVSHDLRAPLRAIDGFSRKVAAGYGDKLDDEGRRLVQVVRDNAQRMGQLIDDLLAFSRLSRREMAWQSLNMTAMAQGVADELRAAEPQRVIVFTIAALPAAAGDAALLRQVWVNLLSNAVKFTGQREIAHIEIGGREDGDEVQYWVTDNGAGFDMQYADKLFGVFQRLHRQDEFEGTGVGLAITQRILQRHGGRIWGEGKTDSGATFGFALPRHPSSEAPFSGVQ